MNLAHARTELRSSPYASHRSLGPAANPSVPAVRSGSPAIWNRLIGPGAMHGENLIQLLVPLAADMAGGVATAATNTGKRWSYRAEETEWDPIGFPAFFLKLFDAHLPIVAPLSSAREDPRHA